MGLIEFLSSYLNFSGLSIFWHASPIVQLVMIILLCASVVSWAIIIEKIILFRRCRTAIKKFEKYFWSGRPLGQLYQKFDHSKTRGLPMIFIAAMSEWKKSGMNGVNFPTGIEGRISRAIDVAMSREIDYLSRRLSLLATIGSSAPFIGLLGTVVGIMISFQMIAESQTTNLTVIAPGISEALLATAIGLFVAIPAVIAYNRLQEKMNAIIVRLEIFSDEFLTILSRQIDEKLSKDNVKSVKEVHVDNMHGIIHEDELKQELMQ